jgi:hypothetical protein
VFVVVKYVRAPNKTFRELTNFSEERALGQGYEKVYKVRFMLGID